MNIHDCPTLSPLRCVVSVIDEDLNIFVSTPGLQKLESITPHKALGYRAPVIVHRGIGTNTNTSEVRSIQGMHGTTLGPGEDCRIGPLTPSLK